MRVLVITNFAPMKENPMAGLFVVKRLEQYPKFDIDYLAVSLGFKDGWDVRFIKDLLQKNSNSPLNYLGNVKFEPILIPRNLIKVILTKMCLVYNAKLVKGYLYKIEFRLDIFQFDLIHAHGMYQIPAGEIAYLLAREFNKPFVVTLHGNDVNLFMPKRRKGYIEILEEASKVIFVSKALFEKAKSFGYSGKNAVVIPNGYDPTIFKPQDKNEVRRQLGIYAEGYKYVGFVGNLVEIKRADKLIEIFDKIRENIESVKFIVVGDGHLREKLGVKNTLTKEGYGDNTLVMCCVRQHLCEKNSRISNQTLS